VHSFRVGNAAAAWSWNSDARQVLKDRDFHTVDELLYCLEPPPRQKARADETFASRQFSIGPVVKALRLSRATFDVQARAGEWLRVRLNLRKRHVLDIQYLEPGVLPVGRDLVWDWGRPSDLDPAERAALAGLLDGIARREISSLSAPSWVDHVDTLGWYSTYRIHPELGRSIAVKVAPRLRYLIYARPLELRRRRHGELHWIEYVLYLTLPRHDGDQIIGDLLEEYEQDIIPKFGQAKARFWLYRHAASLLNASVVLRRIAIIAAISRWLGIMR